MIAGTQDNGVILSDPLMHGVEHGTAFMAVIPPITPSIRQIAGSPISPCMGKTFGGLPERRREQRQGQRSTFARPNLMQIVCLQLFPDL